MLMLASKTSDSCENAEAAKGTICVLTEETNTTASLNKVFYIIVICVADKQIGNGE
jgi:hypothetical protein